MLEWFVTDILLRRMPHLVELDCATLKSEIVRRLPQYTPCIVTLRAARIVGGIEGPTWSALAKLGQLRTLDLLGSIIDASELAQMPWLETLRLRRTAYWYAQRQAATLPLLRLRCLTVTMDRQYTHRLMSRCPALSTAEISVDAADADNGDACLVMRLEERRVTFRTRAATEGSDATALFAEYAVVESLLGSLRPLPLSCEFDESVSLALQEVLARDFARLVQPSPAGPLRWPSPSAAALDSDSETEPEDGAEVDGFLRET
jgi:hypothetical protein